MTSAGISILPKQLSRSWLKNGRRGSSTTKVGTIMPGADFGRSGSNRSLRTTYEMKTPCEQ